MGLIRLAIFAVVIWMFWRLIKNFLAKQAKMNKKESGKLEQGNIVLCEYCSVHVQSKKRYPMKNCGFVAKNTKKTIFPVMTDCIRQFAGGPSASTESRPVESFLILSHASH